MLNWTLTLEPQDRFIQSIDLNFDRTAKDFVGYNLQKKKAVQKIIIHTGNKYDETFMII